MDLRHLRQLRLRSNFCSVFCPQLYDSKSEKSHFCYTFLGQNSITQSGQSNQPRSVQDLWTYDWHTPTGTSPPPWPPTAARSDVIGKSENPKILSSQLSSVVWGSVNLTQPKHSLTVHPWTSYQLFSESTFSEYARNRHFRNIFRVYIFGIQLGLGLSP